MKKKIAVSILFALVLVSVICGSLRAETIEETLTREFPGADFDAIKPTDIKGMYEIVKDADVIYFVPDPGYLIVGDIYDKEGRNVTQERKGGLFAESAKNLPLDKAIKVGSGKNTVIEFTDPDCPYCRTAAAFLEKRKDVTRYIFFFPLPMHQDAENKIKYIFCAADRAKAYEDAMQGKFDDQKYEKCAKPEAAELLELHKQIGLKMRISGTPFFIINGKKSVVGANIPELEEALKK
jgi:thiol:disulfide interchange protein DsbC